ncbi:MAG: potassium channel family protein [Planctomycetota bacterium]|jgi:voltage-gated potassium channel
MVRRLTRSLISNKGDRSIVRLCTLLAVIVCGGTVGFVTIEGWSVWESFFFTLITLMTVGYGDHGVSESGEMLAAAVMIAGIGTLSFTISRVMYTLLDRITHPEKAMIERASQLENHCIVCGLGRTGQRVIRRLQVEGKPVVGIDTDERRVEAARELGIIALVGNATEDSVLMMAGIESASTLAALTSNDAVNALICLSATHISEDVHVIGRAEDDSSISKLERAGASLVISPAAYGGDGIAEYILKPEVSQLLPGIGSGPDGLQFADIVIDERSALAGRRVADIGGEHPNIVFIAVRHESGELRLHPGGNQILSVGDVIVVASNQESVGTLRHQSRAA